MSGGAFMGDNPFTTCPHLQNVPSVSGVMVTIPPHVYVVRDYGKKSPLMIVKIGIILLCIISSK